MKITLPLFGRVLAGVLLLLILLALSFCMLSLFAPARITVTTSGGTNFVTPTPPDDIEREFGFTPLLAGFLPEDVIPEPTYYAYPERNYITVVYQARYGAREEIRGPVVTLFQSKEEIIPDRPGDYPLGRSAVIDGKSVVFGESPTGASLVISWQQCNLWLRADFNWWSDDSLIRLTQEMRNTAFDVVASMLDAECQPPT